MARRRRRRSADGLLGTLEYDILRVLWRQAPASVGTVLEQLNRQRGEQDPLAYTTVMTVLARLHDKGLADRDKQGRAYRYTPRYDEPALIDHLGGQEVARLLDRYGQVALAQFASALQQADPDLLRQVTELANGGDDDDA
ncbi:MAG TPA: BlaI/MecI/CopY family transcriptional regulator [Nitriliruptorales bacterium]